MQAQTNRNIKTKVSENEKRIDFFLPFFSSSQVKHIYTNINSKLLILRYLLTYLLMLYFFFSYSFFPIQSILFSIPLLPIIIIINMIFCTDSCRYTKGTWTECDPKTNTRSRTLTLKKGEGSCVQTRTIQKKCKKGKSEKGKHKINHKKLIYSCIK